MTLFGFGKRKKDMLPLKLPALEQPELPEAPSVRIMKIAGMRSLVYGLMAANGISLFCAVGFYALLVSRIEEVPYVADGSSYGCSPAPADVEQAGAEQAPETPKKPDLEPLAPTISEG